MAKTININVRLRQYKGKNTSARKSVSTKKEKTSSKPNVSALKTESAMTRMKSLGNVAKGGLGGIATIALVSKAVNTAGRVSGTVTGNQFSAKRMQDTATFMMTPHKAISKMYERVFELQREIERVDIERQKTNTYMPFRYGDRGITI